LSSRSNHEELLTCIGTLYCKENGVKFDVSREVHQKICNLTSRAGIDLRCSLNKCRVKRAQVDFESGSLQIWIGLSDLVSCQSAR